MMMKKVKGKCALINFLNKVLTELHIPGYNWCSPGTSISEHLASGDSSINPLDSACKEHDIAYSKNQKDIKLRNLADKKLAEKANIYIFPSQVIKNQSSLHNNLYYRQVILVWLIQ